MSSLQRSSDSLTLVELTGLLVADLKGAPDAEKSVALGEMAGGLGRKLTLTRSSAERVPLPEPRSRVLQRHEAHAFVLAEVVDQPL
jgi:hypothetical protein